MPQNSLRKLFAACLLLAVLWLGLRYLLPILMPFLLAAALAAAAEPLVRFWQKRTGLPRAAATGLGVSMALMLLILGLMILSALLIRQLRALAEVAPDLENTAAQGIASLEAWLLSLADKAPDGIESLLNRSIENLFSGGSSLTDRITAWLLQLVSNIVSQVPDSLLGIGTWLLACFMLSAKLPRIQAWLQAKLPSRWKEQWLPVLRRLKKSLLGWILAQCKLMSITFLVLTVCFFALQISYAPIWALIVSLVDALPVLGTGTILIPWSLVCFLQGQTVRGVGLLGAYAAAWTLRSVMEPRLVGKQLGLDPLITLAAMYAGYRIFGIGGMILSPLLAVTVTQLLAARKKI